MVSSHSFVPRRQLTASRVPKELISRFVKLCPTCRIRRGMNRNSPGEDQDTPPDMDDTEPNDEIDSPVKSRRESTIGAQDNRMVDMPMQLVNGSTTFQSQNRWLSDFHTPQSAYDSLYSPASTAATSSFSAVNSYEHNHSNRQNRNHSTSNNVSSTHSRPVSSHQPRFKQDMQYCYD